MWPVEASLGRGAPEPPPVQAEEAVAVAAQGKRAQAVAMSWPAVEGQLVVEEAALRAQRAPHEGPAECREVRP